MPKNNPNQKSEFSRRSFTKGLTALLTTLGVGGCVARNSPIEILRRYTSPYDISFFTDTMSRTSPAEFVLWSEHFYGLFDRESYNSARNTIDTIVEDFSNSSQDLVERYAGYLRSADDPSQVPASRGAVQSTVRQILRGIDSSIRTQVPERERKRFVTDSFTGPVSERRYDCDIYALAVLEIAQRCNLPISAMRSPEHFFTVWSDTYRDSEIQVVLDQGVVDTPISDYESGAYSGHRARPVDENCADGVYLTPMSTDQREEFIANYLRNIEKHLRDNNKPSEALELSNLTTRLAPTNPAVAFSYYLSLRETGYYSTALETFNRVLDLDPTFFELSQRSSIDVERTRQELGEEIAESEQRGIPTVYRGGSN